MPYQIEAPDGQVYEFEDNVPHDAVKAWFQKTYPPSDVNPSENTIGDAFNLGYMRERRGLVRGAADIAKTFGDEESYKDGVRQFHEFGQEMAQYDPITWDEATQSFGNMVRYVGHGAAISAPSTLIGLVSTAFGGVLGGIAGLTPGFYGDMVGEQLDEGATEETLEKGKALGAAAGAASLDVILDKFILNRWASLKKPPGTTPRSAKKAIGIAMAAGAGIEAVTEVGQEAITILQANPELLLELSPEALARFKESFFGGLVLGGVFGGGSQVGIEVARRVMKIDQIEGAAARGEDGPPPDVHEPAAEVITPEQLDAMAIAYTEKAENKRRAYDEDRAAGEQGELFPKDISPLEGGENARASEMAVKGRPDPEGFYSTVETAIRGTRQQRAKPGFWRNLIKNSPGVRKDELDFLGFEVLLDDLVEEDGKIDRDLLAKELERAQDLEVLTDSEFIHPHMDSSPDMYMSYTIPGMIDYMEALYGLPADKLASIKPNRAMQAYKEAKQKYTKSLESLISDGVVSKELGQVPLGSHMIRNPAFAGLYEEFLALVGQAKRYVLTDDQVFLGDAFEPLTAALGKVLKEEGYIDSSVEWNAGEFVAEVETDSAWDYLIRSIAANSVDLYNLRDTAKVFEGRVAQSRTTEAGTSHWDPEFKNSSSRVFGHVRAGLRRTLDGSLNYHIAEVQSDAASAYNSLPEDYKSQVEVSPYLRKPSNWLTLSLRHQLTEAIKAGADNLLVDTGTTQILRYNTNLSDAFGATWETSEGSEVAKALIKDEEKTGRVIHSSGVARLYDTTIPQILNKLGRKFGVKAEKSDIRWDATGIVPEGFEDLNAGPREGSAVVWKLPITEEMKAEILTEGQPTFAISPEAQKGPNPIDPKDIDNVIRRAVARFAPHAKVLMLDDSVSAPGAYGVEAYHIMEFARNELATLENFGKVESVGLHEAVHYLDKRGFFTREEQALFDEHEAEIGQLASQGSARFGTGKPSDHFRWSRETRKGDTWKHAGIRRTEALSYAMQEVYNRQQEKPKWWAPLQKVIDFLHTIGREFRKILGRQTFEDITERTIRGEVGRRGTKQPRFSSFSRMRWAGDVDGISHMTFTPKEVVQKVLSGTQIVDAEGRPQLLFEPFGQTNPFARPVLYTTPFDIVGDPETAQGVETAISQLSKALEAYDKPDATPEEIQAAEEALELYADTMDQYLWGRPPLPQFVAAKNVFDGRKNEIQERIDRGEDIRPILRELERDGYDAVRYEVKEGGNAGDAYIMLGGNINGRTLQAFNYDAHAAARMTAMAARGAGGDLSPYQMQPPATKKTGRTRRVGWASSTRKAKNIIFTPRHLAATFKPFADVWLEIQKRVQQRMQIVARAARDLNPYADILTVAGKMARIPGFNIPPPARLWGAKPADIRRARQDIQSIHAALEVLRNADLGTEAITRRGDGGGVLKNEHGDLQLSSRGDMIELSPAAMDGLLATQTATRNIFSQLRGAFLRRVQLSIPTGKRGANGEPLYKTVDVPAHTTAADLRMFKNTFRKWAAAARRDPKGDPHDIAGHASKQADNLADVLDKVEAMDEAMTKAYVPFVRFGETFVGVFDGDNVLHLEGVEGTRIRLGKKKNERLVTETVERLRRKYGPEADIVEFDNLKDKRLSPGNVQALEQNFDALMSMLNPHDEAQFAEVLDKVRDLISRKGWRGHMVKANLTPGYSTEFDRALNRYTNMMASAISAMEHGARARGLAQSMDTVPEIRDHREGKLISNYAKDYVEYSLSPQEEFGWIRQAMFAHAIGFRADSALLQLFSLPEFVYPNLAAVVGHKKATKAIMSATRDAARIGGNMIKYAWHHGHGMQVEQATVNIGLDDLSGFLPKHERELLHELANRGTLNAVLTLEAQGISPESTVASSGKHHREIPPVKYMLRRSAEIAGAWFNFMEVMARITTALASSRGLTEKQDASSKVDVDVTKWVDLGSARLDLEKMKRARGYFEASGTLYDRQVREDSDLTGAVGYIIDETMGVFGKGNRAKYMRGGMAPITQFQSYPQMMLEMQGRMLRGIFNKNASPADRKALLGAQTLIWGTLIAVGGVWSNWAGENIKELLEQAIKPIVKRDVDLDAEMREMFIDMWDTFGGRDSPWAPFFGDWMTKGFTRAPYDVLSYMAPESSKYVPWPEIGRRGTLADLPVLDMIKALFFGSDRPGEALGVPGSTIAGGIQRVYDEMHYGVPLTPFFDSGPWAARHMLPSFMRNAADAVIWITEGAKTARQNMLLTAPGTPGPALKWADVAMKGLIGFQPMELARAREQVFGAKRAGNTMAPTIQAFRERLITAKTNQILARRSGNAEAALRASEKWKDIIKEIRDFNKGRPTEDRVPLDTRALQSIIREVRSNITPLYRERREAPRRRRSRVREVQELFPGAQGMRGR